MRFNRSLRFRVTLAFAISGAGLSLLLSVWLYWASHEGSVRLMDETLKAEFEDYRARRQRNPRSLPPATLTLLGHVWPTPPGSAPPLPEIRELPMGLHTVRIDEVLYRVLIQDSEEERYFLLYNETRQLARETSFLWLLGAGVLMTTWLASAGGFWLAGRVIAPVTALAMRVRTLEPEAKPAPLADDFPQDELGALAQAFDRHVGRLRAFIERERAFTADVSHELRTPLAVILGAVEIELDRPDLPPRQHQRALRIQRAAQDMTEITSALLALAREAPGSGATPCSMADLVRDIAERHRHLQDRRTIALMVEVVDDPKIMADRALMGIVVSNLIRNALQNTDQGEVRIRLESRRLVIRDTGRGIAAEQLAHIFQRHYKGSDSRGEGIGLALTHRICERYGWNIAVESCAGCGTEVRLDWDKQDIA